MASAPSTRAARTAIERSASSCSIRERNEREIETPSGLSRVRATSATVSPEAMRSRMRGQPPWSWICFLMKRSIGFAAMLPFRSDQILDGVGALPHRDRKSTRLNSSHGYISYAVFCLKKKKYLYHKQHNAPCTHVRHH